MRPTHLAAPVPLIMVITSVHLRMPGHNGPGKRAAPAPSSRARKAARAQKEVTRPGSVSDRMRNLGLKLIYVAHSLLGNPSTVGNSAPTHALEAYYKMLDQYAVYEMTQTKQWLGGDEYDGNRQCEHLAALCVCVLLFSIRYLWMSEYKLRFKEGDLNMTGYVQGCGGSPQQHK